MVELTIYSSDGRRIATLLQRELEAGPHALTWDGRDGGGRPVAAGVYRYRLKGGNWSESRSMVLVK